MACDINGPISQDHSRVEPSFNTYECRGRYEEVGKQGMIRNKRQRAMVRRRALPPVYTTLRPKIWRLKLRMSQFTIMGLKALELGHYS